MSCAPAARTAMRRVTPVSTISATSFSPWRSREHLAGAAGSLYYLSGNTEFFWTTYQSLPAAGFNGIAVALLAVNNPIAVIFTGCFMSILDIAGLQITNLTVYNEYITDVIIAVIVYMAAFSLIIKMWIAERQKKRAKKAEQAAPAAPAAETPAEKREEVQK